MGKELRPRRANGRALDTRRLVLMHEERYRLIPLRSQAGAVRAYALVDADDYAWLMRWPWCLNDYGYAVRRRGTMIYMHRELLSLRAGDRMEGDHVNRNRLDNRRENLRVVTHLENMRNRAGRGPTRGYMLNKKTGRWSAYVHRDGGRIHLGMFATAEEAGAAAKAARARS